jgi:outer membrane biosynthesis protein TonB
MSSFTDLLATQGFVMGLIALGAVCAIGASMLAWPQLRLLGTMAGLLCMLSACSTQTKGSSANRGRETTVKLTSSAKDRYIRQVTGQVEKKWNTYRLLRPDGMTPGSLQIVFYVNKTGKVESPRIVNDKDSNPVLTGFTLQAINDADIPPMPAGVIPLLPKNDPQRLKIVYNVLISPATKDSSAEHGTKTSVSADETRKAWDRQIKEQWDKKFNLTEQTRRIRIPQDGEPAAYANEKPLTRYYMQAVAQVEKKWFLYKTQWQPSNLGALETVFYVNPKGKVENVRVVNDKDSYPLLTKFTLQAIRDAEIPPMPADVIPLLPKNDLGRMKVNYNVLIR